MDELDELRRRKLTQLQDQGDERAQFTKQIEQLEAMVRPAMTKDALTRYGALKTAHQEKALKALVAMAQLVGKGETIDDAKLRNILIALDPQKRDIKIRR